MAGYLFVIYIPAPSNESDVGGSVSSTKETGLTKEEKPLVTSVRPKAKQQRQHSTGSSSSEDSDRARGIEVNKRHRMKRTSGKRESATQLLKSDSPFSSIDKVNGVEQNPANSHPKPNLYEKHEDPEIYNHVNGVHKSSTCSNQAESRSVSLEQTESQINRTDASDSVEQMDSDSKVIGSGYDSDCESGASPSEDTRFLSSDTENKTKDPQDDRDGQSNHVSSPDATKLVDFIEDVPLAAVGNLCSIYSFWLLNVKAHTVFRTGGSTRQTRRLPRTAKFVYEL